MAQGEGFKHITVTAPDDEDVVIHAGLADSEPAAAPAAVDVAVDVAVDAEDSEAIALDDDVADAVGEEAASPEPPVEQAPEQELQRELQSESQRERQARPKPARKPKDDYHETTLEDLQGTPMPLAQKIVIVAAIVCIIGALIYYFAFMR